jgi:hypothetical protein
MVDKFPRDRIRTIVIPPVGLEGVLGLPVGAKGIVLFAHGSGSGRFSPRNNLSRKRCAKQALPHCCSTS